MIGRSLGVLLFLSASSVVLTGCGDGKSGNPASPDSIAGDLAFEGAFVSKAFECVKGGRVTPVARARELRRTLMIVNDHLLVTDANSVDLLSGKRRVGPDRGETGMKNAVTRYYEVSKRNPYSRSSDAVRIEIDPPGKGTVSTMATTIGGNAIRDDQFHPVTLALKQAEKQVWIYAFVDRTLYVFQPDVAESICPEPGSDLRTTYENRNLD